MTNRTKALLANGQVAFGVFIRYPDATLAELIGLGGWDFLVFDGEHGSVDPYSSDDLVRAAELRGATPIARIPSIRIDAIQRFMDAGVHGLHIPSVDTPADVENALRAMKYAPQGNRGLAPGRSSGFGRVEQLSNHAVTANRETLCVVHIETLNAAQQVKDFISIAGVDVLFLGPSDLSSSLGVPGQVDHPSLTALLEETASTVAASEKALGIFVSSASAAAEWRDRGAQYIATGLDGLLAGAMDDFLLVARSAPGAA